MKYSTITHRKAQEFILTLDKADRARVDRYYYLFDEYGPTLTTKYLKKLEKDIWELRPGKLRLFLIIKGNVGYVVHGIKKKTQKTPRRELELVRKRIREGI
ncbi:MAG: type II toxin-antitoxin system RelE/ParE family toxin [Patescibacteria group bacterium]